MRDVARARRASRSATRGSWRSPSGCSTASASRAASTAMGLPKAEIPLALLLFNVGVEIGQVAFVLLVVRLERSFRVLEVRWPRARRAAAGLRGGLARRVLDDPAHARAAGRGPLMSPSSPRHEPRSRDDGAVRRFTLAADALARARARARGARPRRGPAGRPPSPGLRPRPRARDGRRSGCGAPSSARRRSGCCR